MIVAALCTVFLSVLETCSFADELILDETATAGTTVGDFDVSTFVSSVQLEQAGLLDSSGTITAGDLYKVFKEKGVTSVYAINLCLDVQDTDLRADYALDSIELRIEDLDGDNLHESLFSLGADNSLTLPGYEKSDAKPEAKLSINLGYDFMEKFNENSIEKLKFDYVASDGERNSLPVKVGVLLPSAGHWSWSRLLFLSVFTGFWVVVFLVLFRVTTPKSPNAAYPA